MDLLLSREPIGRGSLEEPRRRPEHHRSAARRSTGKHEAADSPRRRRQDRHQRRSRFKLSPGPRPPRSRSSLKPTECRTPRGSSSCPRREGRGRGPLQRRRSSHVRWRWFFPAVSVLPAMMMVVVASRMQLPLLLLRSSHPTLRRKPPSSSLSPREEEPNHPPPLRQTA